MKFRTLKRHFREGIKNIFRNGWMSIASIGAVTVTLVLVSAFLIIMLNLNQMAKKVEADVVINALIDLTADSEDIKALGEDIEKLDGVESVIFSSNDEELKKFMDSMGDEGDSWGLIDQDNPLRHTYIVQPANPGDTEPLAKKIEEMANVYKVNYGQDVIKNLFQFNKYARTIGLVLIGGLILTAIFLISNTIKITIMARSREIGIMKLVGATNNFIRWPFFIEGMFLGILGAIIPIMSVLGIYYYIDANVVDRITYEFFDILPFNPFAWQLSLLVLAIGALIGIWGSVMSVRKFLNV
ncbi:permease-like cell division protein FtsX [Lentibacillus saliphilus]|uniref:permease-like cell division protein FtsX n=1 Tax=Lentibacillus saliphilus TaxID=2737028 RepID=UPI001C2F5326|nr:permease-like cell division protein FtsX [Lentibacillus saliphilus]